MVKQNPLEFEAVMWKFNPKLKTSIDSMLKDKGKQVVE